MSLFQRPLQPPAILSDQAVERYLAAVRAEISLDPLFRRQLRGSVVNRFVAEREGRTAPEPRRMMGSLGRAVLYATFALSVSVSSAMAASQGSAPGDALYPLKLQIERLRLQALPAHLHDDLAAHALGERIHEMGILAERGDWARVASQAEAVQGEYRHFVDTMHPDGSSNNHLFVLSALLDRLPDRAQLAIEEVLDGVETASEAVDRGNQGRGQGQGQGQGSGSTNNAGGGGAPAGEPPATAPAIPDPTPKPTPPPRPDPTPRAPKSPKPSAASEVPPATDAADASDAGDASDASDATGD